MSATDSSTSPLRCVVAQRGAREHFLVARALCRKGALTRLVTDFYNPFGRLKPRAPGLARRLGTARAWTAHHPDLPWRKVDTMCLLGLSSRWREWRARTSEERYRAFLRHDSAFAHAVARRHLPDHDVFFCYSYASLEALEVERERGHLTIVDQIDPAKTEFDIVERERQAWPGWEPSAGLPPDEYWGRARREWDVADIVVVNSEWTKQALVEQGVPPEKLKIIPLAYEAPVMALQSAKRNSRGKLRVLWLGSVILRKGIQYLIEAARLVAQGPIEFTVAGPVRVSSDRIREAGRNMTFLGAVPRSATSALYSRHDVFVLPTVSDGFGITQVEALAHGLPVVVTPNCAKVVTDGLDGFVVPARSGRVIADVLVRLAEDRKLLSQMSANALRTARKFNVDAYADRLLDIVREGTSSHT